jgi:hypothetical protein
MSFCTETDYIKGCPHALKAWTSVVLLGSDHLPLVFVMLAIAQFSQKVDSCGYMLNDLFSYE